jgi:hypothetical protein
MFIKISSAYVMRKEKLDIKVKACLWNHILFWISDCLSFEEALSPLAGDAHRREVALIMSPSYLSAEEAQFLGSLMMPNIIGVHDILSHMGALQCA